MKRLKYLLFAALSLRSAQAFTQITTVLGAPQPVYRMAEQMPEFHGDLSRFLSSNLRYPDSARVHNAEGRSVVQFVVEKTGAIGPATLMRSSGNNYLDREALRVVMLMPRWEPGKQKGETVAVYYTLPVTFKLED